VKNDPDRRKPIIETIEKSNEFKAVLHDYSTLKDVLKNQLHAIVQGAYGYKHDYIIIEKTQRLVYKENDSINYKLSYGYKTVFANLYEYGRGKVSKLNLDESLCIELVVAEFAYAVLPTFFAHIIGVTGTLKAMPMVKKRILRDKYDVKDNYLIPSSFGLN
jgi:hypothetical protein